MSSLARILLALIRSSLDIEDSTDDLTECKLPWGFTVFSEHTGEIILVTESLWSSRPPHSDWSTPRSLIVRFVLSKFGTSFYKAITQIYLSNVGTNHIFSTCVRKAISFASILQISCMLRHKLSRSHVNGLRP